ncbi:hypothetical protein PMAYCL1PPCAC_03160, partial [Pristionchus mayeri]
QIPRSTAVHSLDPLDPRAGDEKDDPLPQTERPSRARNGGMCYCAFEFNLPSSSLRNGMRSKARIRWTTST